MDSISEFVFANLSNFFSDSVSYSAVQVTRRCIAMARVMLEANANGVQTLQVRPPGLVAI